MKKFRIRHLLFIGGFIVCFAIGKNIGEHSIYDAISRKESELQATKYELKNSKQLNKEMATMLNRISSEHENSKLELADLRKLVESTTFVTQDELKVLQRIVAAEATSGNLDQKINVAQTVVNRVESRHFPNDVKRVVFQKNQFQPTFDGRYYKVGITEDDIEAVDKVLRGEANANKDTLYFMVEKWSDKKNVNWFKNNLEYVMNDGVHSYYKLKNNK